MDTIAGYLEPEEARAIINAIPDVSTHTERDRFLPGVIWQTGCRIIEAVILVLATLGLTPVLAQTLIGYDKFTLEFPLDKETDHAW